MACLPVLSDDLRRRFECEERRNSNKRRVFGYRLPDGSLDDNLIVHGYFDLSACKTYWEHVFSLVGFRREIVDVEFVYLGVWCKDKRKFDFLRVPKTLFRIGDVMKDEGDKK